MIEAPPSQEPSTKPHVVGGNSSPMIAVRSVAKKIGQQEILRGVDLEVATGETLAIIGRSGGGKSGTQVPLLNGSTKLNGSAGPNPGNPGRFSNADSKGTGGVEEAVPSAGSMGSSNFRAGGSEDEVACCGSSSTRLAQRERTMIFPSVITVSPFLSLTIGITK